MPNPIFFDALSGTFEKGRVVIFAAWTGNPDFTTDTVAVLRAQEIHAEILLKATKVDGVYDADPVTHPDARFLKDVTYMDVLERQLKAMEMTAISLAMDNKLPLSVFDLNQARNIRKVVCGGIRGHADPPLKRPASAPFLPLSQQTTTYRTGGAYAR